MLIWADGFDHYGDAPNGGRDAMLAGAWAAFSAGSGTLPAISSEQARTGTYSLKFVYNPLATAGVQARRVLGAAEISVGTGFGLYLNALPATNGEYGFEFRNASNQAIATLMFQSDGAVALYIGTGHVLTMSSDPVLTASAWHHVEAHILADTVVGECEVRVNGLTVLHATDLNLGALGATQIVYGMPNTDTDPTGLTWYMDDVFAWDDSGLYNNDFIGTARVETVFATGDTAEADWTKVGAANGYDCIDNVPPDADTTYLMSDLAGHVSEFTLGTLPPETEIIHGVYIPTMAKLEDAGTGNVQTSLVSGVDVSLGPDQVLTTAYTYWGGVHETDPATDLAWTKAGLEAAKLRIEKTV